MKDEGFHDKPGVKMKEKEKVSSSTATLGKLNIPVATIKALHLNALALGLNEHTKNINLKLNWIDWIDIYL